MPVDKDQAFRIAVLGDFSGRENRGLVETGRQLAQRRPIEIDRDNFDQVMVRLGVELTDLLVAPDESVSLKFASLEDFDPGRLYDEVGLFAALRGLRRRLGNADTFEAAAQEIAGWGEAEAEPAETTPAEPAAAESEAGEASSVDDLLDRILSDASSSASTSEAAAGVPWQRMIRELVEPLAMPTPDRDRQQDLVRCVDRAAQATMTALLHHPGFQRLEAAWRALQLLVRGLETDAKLKVFLIDVTRHELAQDLLADDELSQTGLHQLLVGKTRDIPGAVPWSLLAGDYYFGSSDEDAALLTRLARVAAACGAPLLTGARGSVVGCSGLAAAADPDGWQPEPSPDWQALRGLSEAAFVGLAWPRFLLRLPYGSRTRPVERFEFEEVTGGPQSARLLWGNSAFLCTTLLGQAFTQSGWDLQPGEFNEFGNLPVWIYDDEDGDQRAHPCGEYLLSDQAVSRVASCGVMPMISASEQDVVRIGAYFSLGSTPLSGRWH